MHAWLVPELESLSTRRGQYLNVLGPRGSAKSTWASFCYPLWCACEGIEPYILLLSDTGPQAKKYLESIRAELEGNAELAFRYPAACGRGTNWRVDSLRLRNGVLIESLGSGAGIRGRKNRSRRPTLVINDDLQNEETIVSPVQRERDWQWFTRGVLEVGEPGITNHVVIGTALHREAIVCRLQTPKDGAGWRSRVFRAVEKWPDRMDLWREWEQCLTDPRLGDDDREKAAATFYAANRGAMDQGAELLWPEREPLEFLMRRRAILGPAAFASEKQNDPINPEDCEWPAEYFDHPLFWFDDWPATLAVKTMSLDPSKGRGERSDLSAFIRFGRDAQEVEYVEADLRRRNAAAIVTDGIEHVQQFRPERFVIEANAFQDLFAPLFLAEAKKQNVDLSPILALDHNSVDKDVRIRRLTAPLAKRRIRFKARSPGTAILVQQLRDFPNADFRDGPDALEMARRLAIELSNSRPQQRRH